MSAYDCGQVSAFMQETCHDLLRDQDQMGSMAVYKRAKFESYLGVAVGIPIARHPPHKTVRALLRIRLPPWIIGVKAFHGIRM